MKLDEFVSEKEWFATGCCFLFGTILRSVFITGITGRDSWFAAITGFLVFLPIMFVYVTLIKHYPGKDIYEISSEVFGRLGGGVVNVGIILFLVSLAYLNLLTIGEFISTYMIRGALLIVIIAASVLCALYIIKKGIHILLRLMPVILAVGSLLIFLSIFQTIPAAKFTNLLPMFRHHFKDYVQSTVIAAAIPYGESFVMLTLIPHVRGCAGFRKPYLRLMVFTLITVFLTHVRDAVALGPLLRYATLPSYEVYRIYGAANMLIRTESINAAAMMLFALVKTTIILYAIMRGLSHLTGTSSVKPFAALMCAFVATLASAFQSSPLNSNSVFAGVAPIIWLIFEAFVPTMMLLAALAKARLARPKEGEAAI